MNPKREAGLRNAVARLMNTGLRQKPLSTDEPLVDADDLFVWEVIKVIRNSALNDARSVVDALRHLE